MSVLIAVKYWRPSPLAGEGGVGGASANLYKSSAHPLPFDSPPRKGEGRRYIQRPGAQGARREA
jgi:hypothetical protein